MPIFSRSLPQYTVRSPRAKSDFTHSGESFLSEGTILSKSSRVNGPAITGSRENAKPAAVIEEAFRKDRRSNVGFLELCCVCSLGCIVFSFVKESRHSSRIFSDERIVLRSEVGHQPSECLRMCRHVAGCSLKGSVTGGSVGAGASLAIPINMGNRPHSLKVIFWLFHTIWVDFEYVKACS